MRNMAPTLEPVKNREVSSEPEIEGWFSSENSISSSLLGFGVRRSEEERFSSENSFVFLDGEISIFDGSQINPIEEASLVLDVALENIQEVFEEDLQTEIVAWLYNSVGDDMRDDSITCSESTESSYEPSDSSVFESSWTSLSTEDDGSASPIQDFDRTGSWVSLLDLEDEDLELFPGKERGFDLLESDFPSPSFKILRPNFEIELSNSSLWFWGNENLAFNSLHRGDKEGDLVSGNDDPDEPLFWPFDRVSYLRSEANGLCISPRRNLRTLHKLCSSKSIRLRVHKINQQATDLKERCNPRKVIFNSKSTTSNVLDSEAREGNNQSIRRTRTEPSTSRLSGSIQSSYHGPAKMKDGTSQRLQLRCGSPDQKVSIQSKVDCSVEDYHRKLHECIGSDEEVPIETLVGLSEFDGHEGIDAEFHESGFSLDGPIYESVKNVGPDGHDSGSLCTSPSS